MQSVRIGGVEVSRFIIGSNPFSGFSHQGAARDSEMVHYYTVARIKDVLRQGEKLGIATVLGRTDQHLMRTLTEYWDEGGTLQWIAQTCPGTGTQEACIDRAAEGGARAIYLHGGMMDWYLAQGKTAEVLPLIDRIRNKGLSAGIAGHNPKVFEWAEEAGLNLDFYMCSYYNAAHRDQRAEHVSGMPEWFRDEDRRIMTDLIQKLPRPVIHYKILAAGRNKPEEAIAFAASRMRPGDAVCVGIFNKSAPDMLARDVALFESALRPPRP